jgi:hypothetical protein
MKKILSIIYFKGIILLLFASALYGQKSIAEAKDLEVKFYQSRKTSSELIKAYSWDSRTDVTKEGKVMDILIEQFRYGSNGELHRKIINDQEAKLPSSFLIHGIAEEMKTKMISFMDNLRIFLEEYALADQQKGSIFLSKAKIGSPDPEGQILVCGEDVIIKGDKLLWWIDAHKYTITRASISTSFEGDEIEFTATYKYILPGLNYMAFAEILVPPKNIMVQLHCYDYMKVD